MTDKGLPSKPSLQIPSHIPATCGADSELPAAFAAEFSSATPVTSFHLEKVAGSGGAQ